MRLPYALWVERTTCSSVRWFNVTELMYGYKPVMPIEETIKSSIAMSWENELSQEDIFTTRIGQLERGPEDVKLAKERLKEAGL